MKNRESSKTVWADHVEKAPCIKDSIWDYNVRLMAFFEYCGLKIFNIKLPKNGYIH